MDTKALHKITYGLYVIGATDGAKYNAQIANTLIQVCSKPPRVSVCLSKENLTHDLLLETGVFSASILSQDTPLDFIGGLGFRSGRDADKLAGLTWEKGETGAPIVMDNAVAYLEARLTVTADVGTHTIFVGDVVSAEVLRQDEPITYAYYQQVKRGSTPKTAPSYVEKQPEPASSGMTADQSQSEEGTRMDKYECNVCGYVYDPEQGDPEGNIPPGTPFEKLPDDWVCPVCGAGKDEFSKVS